MMEILAADAEKYEADAERLGHEIDELDHDLAHIAEETKAAIKARNMEHADFLEEHLCKFGDVCSFAPSVSSPAGGRRAR